MPEAVHGILRRVGRRRLTGAVGLLLILLVVVSAPPLLGSRVGGALGLLDRADPAWLWLAGGGFVLAVIGGAGSWLSAIRLCGGQLRFVDAFARFGVGSLVNTFVPARAGDAVRVGLFSRALPNRERLWTAGGAFAALMAARTLVLSAIVVAGAVTGALPAWTLVVLAAVVAGGAALAYRARRRTEEGRLGHVLDAFRALGREPRAALRLFAWIALSTAGFFLAATAVGAALGIHRPLVAALLIVPAVEVAGLVPVTPGNVGVTSGAIAIAFRAHGISLAHGLAAGIAFHAVETAVGILYGLTSLVWVAPYPSPGLRRVAVVGVLASGFLAIAGTFSATVLVPLV